MFEIKTWYADRAHQERRDVYFFPLHWSYRCDSFHWSKKTEMKAESSDSRYRGLKMEKQKHTSRDGWWNVYSYKYCYSRLKTGFVETLKPHFVPGQAMAGSLSSTISNTANLVEEKLTHMQLVQENDNLKSQVRIVNGHKSNSHWKNILIKKCIAGNRSHRKSGNSACEANAGQGEDERVREGKDSGRTAIGVQVESYGESSECFV